MNKNKIIGTNAKPDIPETAGVVGNGGGGSMIIWTGGLRTEDY